MYEYVDKDFNQNRKLSLIEIPLFWCITQITLFEGKIPQKHRVGFTTMRSSNRAVLKIS